MNKKILIGSIIAVVILVLVSFSGVVGYQTTKSTTIARASPLFKVRTNRAIGEESKVLTCKYVGKGSTLPFPKRNDKAVMVQKVIDGISRMDDKTFEKVIVSIINHAQKDNRFNSVKPDEIREAFNLVRDSDESIPIFDADIEKKNHMRNIMYTVPTGCGWITLCGPKVTFCGIKGILGCILLPFLLLYIGIIGIIQKITVLLGC